MIISEKRIKRAAHLKLAQVPYPFTSREQYERAMARPIGREWNTAASVRAATRPEVSVRAGVAIAPITKTKDLKRAQASARDKVLGTKKKQRA